MMIFYQILHMVSFVKIAMSIANRAVVWYDMGMTHIGVMIERVRAYGRNLCEGIVRFCKERDDWSLVMLDWSDRTSQKALRHLDGFIVRITDRRCAATFARTGRPTIDVLCHVPHPGIGNCDQHATSIGQIAVRHFIEHRFTRFAFFGHEGQPYSDRRRSAFAECLRLNHCSCSIYPTPKRAFRDFNTTVIREERYVAGAESKDIGKWIAGLDKPVAVLCSNDLRAYQLINECNRLGIKVPEEVAVLGVDNDELTCCFTTPTISSIDPNARQIGYAAAKALSEMIERPGRGTVPQIAVKPSGLVERGSTQTYPIDPPWLSDALVFIRGNVAKRLAATDVFEHVKRSHTVVDAAFRKALNSTVSKEIARSRISEARRLLDSSTLPIGQIAQLSGYATVQYFTNSFTAATGCSPAAYRTRPHLA